MSLEAAVLISKDHKALHWHLPSNRSSVYLPDTRDLWDVIWENRENLLGIAHSHPGAGVPGPSIEDLTTFKSMESALGKRLRWWICSKNELIELRWAGPDPLTYSSRHLVQRPLDESSSWPPNWREGARWQSLRQERWLKNLRDVSYNLEVKDGTHDQL